MKITNNTIDNSRLNTAFTEFSFKSKLLYFAGIVLQKIILEPIGFRRLQKTRTLFKSISNQGYNYVFDNSTIKIRINSSEIILRKNASDLQVFEQIYINGEYDPLIDLLNTNNIPVINIIDAGSNVGLASMKFLEAFPNCNIICIEPDSGNFSTLQSNLKVFNHRVKFLQKALWFKEADLYIDNKFRDQADWSKTVSGNANTDLKKVQGISMKDLINLYNLETIDVLKIDIEGSEAEIFKEENDLFFLNLVKVIALEIHDEFHCREAIYDILRTRNFTIFNSGESTIGINRAFLTNELNK